jgi:hypothetical protein
LAGNEREAAPGSGSFGEVPGAVEPRARECAEVFGEPRLAVLNADRGAMFAA